MTQTTRLEREIIRREWVFSKKDVMQFTCYGIALGLICGFLFGFLVSMHFGWSK